MTPWLPHPGHWWVPDSGGIRGKGGDPLGKGPTSTLPVGSHLVGGYSPTHFEKYAQVKFRPFPPGFGVKIKILWNYRHLFKGLPSLKLTARTWKWMVGSWKTSFFLGFGLFKDKTFSDWISFQWFESLLFGAIFRSASDVLRWSRSSHSYME